MNQAPPARLSNIQRPPSQAAFLQHFHRCKIFCARFPVPITFKDKKVLDVGCGIGALCLHAMDQGAAAVDGVDIDARRIGFAADKLQSEYRRYAGRVRFFAGTLAELPAEEQYDVILSEAAFEHILHPAAVLAEMHKRLAPQGRAFIGFGPLFRAPWGDHGFLQAPLKRVFPWAHLLFTEQRLLSRRNRGEPHLNLQRLQDVGLNGLTLAEFRRIFRGCALQAAWFAVNRSEHPLACVLQVLEHFPALQEYFAFNVYCILQKDPRVSG